MAKQKNMFRSIIIFIFALSIQLFSQTAIAPSTGDGTAANPYQIANLNNLYWIAANTANWDKNYIQTADIDASSTSEWDELKGWIPIGSYEKPFTGMYDGNNYAINGIYINRAESSSELGFIAYIEGEIKNLGLTNIYVKGSNNVGGLVGLNWYSDAKISRCYVTGDVFGNDYRAGGLIGGNWFADISDCYSSCYVEGKRTVGGLIGENEGGDLNRCYSCGVVKGTDETGGLIGSVSSYSPIINNCYSSSDIIGYTKVGGLIGSISSGTVKNCYSRGLVAGTDNIGGLIGYRWTGIIQNSFWDTETSGQTTSAGGTGKTTTEMKTLSTYADVGWDFTSVWNIKETYNDGYPFLLLPSGIEIDYVHSAPNEINLYQNYPNPLVTQHLFCKFTIPHHHFCLS